MNNLVCCVRNEVVHADGTVLKSSTTGRDAGLILKLK